MRRGMEVSLIKPTSLDDAKEICDYLLAGKAVVLNMEGIHMETAQRIMIYLRSDLFPQRKSPEDFQLYLYRDASSVELSGDFQDLLSGGNLDVSGLNIRL